MAGGFSSNFFTMTGFGSAAAGHYLQPLLEIFRFAVQRGTDYAVCG
jgi:hypothetical protein